MRRKNCTAKIKTSITDHQQWFDATRIVAHNNGLNSEIDLIHPTQFIPVLMVKPKRRYRKFYTVLNTNGTEFVGTYDKLRPIAERWKINNTLVLFERISLIRSYGWSVYNKLRTRDMYCVANCIPDPKPTYTPTHKLYEVDIKKQGVLVDSVTTEAENASDAIAKIEPNYQEPTTTHWYTDKDGQTSLIVKNWGGYMFEARLC